MHTNKHNYVRYWGCWGIWLDGSTNLLCTIIVCVYSMEQE